MTREFERLELEYIELKKKLKDYDLEYRKRQRDEAQKHPVPLQLCREAIGRFDESRLLERTVKYTDQHTTNIAEAVDRIVSKIEPELQVLLLHVVNSHNGTTSTCQFT